MRDTERSRDRGRGDVYARIALLVGLALTITAVGLTLTRRPPVVTRTNGITVSEELEPVASNAAICQGGEVLPADTSAIRLSLFALVGPSVELRVLSGTRVLADGARGAGWTAGAVTVPVKRVLRSASNVTICVTLGRAVRPAQVDGQPTRSAIAATSGGERLRGRMRIEYLRPGADSWWSLILPVARRMGLGHAAAGTWIVLLLAAVLLAAIGVACRLLDAPASSSRQRIPRAALACAFVACMNAVCWSFITPPFQTPDEPDHYAYVQQLAETGQPPSSGQEETYSSQETVALRDLHFYQVRLFPETRTIASRAEQRQFRDDLAQPLSETDDGGAAGVAAAEPPLYYALEAIPFSLSREPLDRVELMRLLSALFAGTTALFVFLFLREALPGVPRVWVVGGLGVALAPLLGFISGAVNPDAMLAAVSAALFYCLARGLRRGLTPQLAVATGAVIAMGFLTKVNFLGLVPGATLGLVVLVLREARKSRRRALRSLLLAFAIAGAPACLYVLLNVLSGDPALGLISSAVPLIRGSVAHQISYIWQFYLPRLPGMKTYFPGVLTTRDIWFDRIVGLYGWLDTVFPGWVYDVAIVPTALMAVLSARALFVSRAALRRRAVELVVYATISVGVLALVGGDSYVHSLVPDEALYAEPRYLLPMAALAGAILAIAARGAGQRWIGAAGSLIVTAVLAYDIVSQLQVIARYYG